MTALQVSSSPVNPESITLTNFLHPNFSILVFQTYLRLQPCDSQKDVFFFFFNKLWGLDTPTSNSKRKRWVLSRKQATFANKLLWGKHPNTQESTVAKEKHLLGNQKAGILPGLASTYDTLTKLLSLSGHCLPEKWAKAPCMGVRKTSMCL